MAKTALLLLVLNEIRGAVMSAPILVGMFHTGPTWLQAWLLLCLAASLVVPVVMWRIR